MRLHFASPVSRPCSFAALVVGLCVISPESANAVSPAAGELAVSAAYVPDGPPLPASWGVFEASSEAEGSDVCEDPDDGTGGTPAGNPELPRCRNVTEDVCEDPCLPEDPTEPGEVEDGWF